LEPFVSFQLQLELALQFGHVQIVVRHGCISSSAGRTGLAWLSGRQVVAARAMGDRSIPGYGRFAGRLERNNSRLPGICALRGREPPTRNSGSGCIRRFRNSKLSNRALSM
jgi:hypothetical protein